MVGGFGGSLTRKVRSLKDNRVYHTQKIHRTGAPIRRRQATTEWSRRLDVEVRGEDAVSHTGSVITRMLADATGLTSALSDALDRPNVVYDRGAVMRDLAVVIAEARPASAISRSWVISSGYSGYR